MKRRLPLIIIILLCLICVFSSYEAVKYRRIMLGRAPMFWTTFWDKNLPNLTVSHYFGDNKGLPIFDYPASKISNAYFSQPRLLTFSADSKSEAIKWKKKLSEKLLELFDFSEVPQKPLQPQLLEKVDLGDVVREKVSYEGYYSRIVAYVFIPKTKIKTSFPAVVVFSGHGRGVIDTTGIIGNSYQHSNALEISKKGYVTITPENITFGMRPANHRTALEMGIMFAKPIVGSFVYEGIKTIDYISGRAEVDPARIGAAGVSLGGEITLFVSAIDERIKACVVAGFLTTYQSLMADRNCGCFWIPGILKYAEIGDIAALIAPRPANFQIGLRDHIALPDVAKSEFLRVQKAYKVYNADENVKISLFDKGHEFFVDDAVSWLDHHLKPE